MSWELFLDDERYPVNDSMVIARSFDEAVELVMRNGMPVFISFDHDLGPDMKTGFDFVKWMVEAIQDGRIDLPDYFGYSVHSQNPIGKKNIIGLLDPFLEFIRDSE